MDPSGVTNPVNDQDATGLYDVVKGTLHVTDQSTGNHCISVTEPLSGCTFKIGGSASVQFDETPVAASGSAVYYQDLQVFGPGLEVKGPVSFGCFGSVGNGNDISLAATFGLRATLPGAGFNRIDFSDHTT